MMWNENERNNMNLNASFKAVGPRYNVPWICVFRDTSITPYIYYIMLNGEIRFRIALVGEIIEFVICGITNLCFFLKNIWSGVGSAAYYETHAVSPKSQIHVFNILESIPWMCRSRNWWMSDDTCIVFVMFLNDLLVCKITNVYGVAYVLWGKHCTCDVGITNLCCSWRIYALVGVLLLTWYLIFSAREADFV